MTCPILPVQYKGGADVYDVTKMMPFDAHHFEIPYEKKR